MKHVLFAFLILPFTLAAARPDPRILKVAPYDGVKSMEVTYIFMIPKGNDTGMTESFKYNEAGMLTDYEYDQHLMKNPPFHIRSVYHYQSRDAWTQMTYKNTKLADSIVVHGGWANSFNYSNGRFHEMHEFRGDSAQEKIVKEGDTITRAKYFVNTSLDPFWDYGNAGKFARKSFAGSVDSDTTSYWDEDGKCMVMVVNFYDNTFRPVKTDYYNYRVKRFDLMYLPYNEQQNMVFFLKRSKKGKWSFEITRKYNEKGWLIEEKFVDKTPGSSVLVKLYNYLIY